MTNKDTLTEGQEKVPIGTSAADRNGVQDSEPSSKTSSFKTKQLKLISVEFKEASVDSPAFRAHVNFFHTRLEMFEDRLQKTVDFYDQKYKTSFEDFQRVAETLMAQLLPSPFMLTNGLVSNQSYTPSVVAHFSNEYKIFFEKIIKVIIQDGNSNSLLLVDLMSKAIEPYKNKRKTFEYFQTKYDNMLNTYQEIETSNILIDPISIKNDALQLHEIRKNYLMASLDLVESISNVKLNLDKYIVDSMNTLRMNNMFMFRESGSSIDLCPSISVYLDDYVIWVENAIEGRKALERDMKHAKKQVYDYALNYFEPSSNVNDYNLQSIHKSLNVANNIHTPNHNPEKSGWLHMKTTVGKQGREVWVRRWCFLQNGVFGMFLLSPSKIYVEETDKFGVFLTQTRHAIDENRKYCFEVKILNGGSQQSGNNHTNGHRAVKNNISIVLQAESLRELKSWLTAFESSKMYVNQLDRSTLAYELAFRRYSPKFFEFASSTTTSMDQLITTFDGETTSLLETLNCSFSEYEVINLTEDKLYEFHMDITPISTKLSQLAILGNYFTKGSWFPNGILVNIWGVTNWSEYSVFDNREMKPASILNGSHHRLSLMNSEKYPSFYNKELSVGDLQLKNIFFTTDQTLTKIRDEFLLFKFNSFWYPNTKQRFPSICYVTKDHIFCYMNTMGFVCLTMIKATEIISVEADKNESHRIILYDINNTQYKVDILFTDRDLVIMKLQILIENKISKSYKTLEALFKRLQEIDDQFQNSSEMKHLQKEQNSMVNTVLRSATNNNSKGNNATNNNESRKSTLNSSNSEDDDMFPGGPTKDFSNSRLINSSTFWHMGDASKILNEKKILEKNASVVYRHDYDIGAKGLIHILFGDLSNAFPKCFFLACADSNQSTNTFWKEKHLGGSNDNKILERLLTFPVDMTHYLVNTRKRSHNNCQQNITIKQRIVKVIENIYYEIEQDPFYVKLPLCRNMKISVRYIISKIYDPKDHVATKLQMSGDGCLLNVLYQIEFVDSNTGEVISKLCKFEELLKNWTLYFTHYEFLLIRKVIRYYLERIGSHGKLIRAMKLCGLLGVSNDSHAKENISNTTDINGSDASTSKETDSSTDKELAYNALEKTNETNHETNQVRYSFVILFKVFLKLIMYRLVNIILFIIRFILDIMIKTKRFLNNLNKTLLFCLITSIIFNLILSGRTTTSYWAVRRAENTFKGYAEEARSVIKEKMDYNAKTKTVYLDDLDILTHELAVEPNNLAYQKFHEQSGQDRDRFKDSRRDLAIRRNELLVELKILQSMEREVIQGDYKKFLLQETAQCVQVQTDMRDTYDADANLQDYCSSCLAELKRLDTLLL